MIVHIIIIYYTITVKITVRKHPCFNLMSRSRKKLSGAWGMIYYHTIITRRKHGPVNHEMWTYRSALLLNRNAK